MGIWAAAIYDWLAWEGTPETFYLFFLKKKNELIYSGYLFSGWIERGGYIVEIMMSTLSTSTPIQRSQIEPHERVNRIWKVNDSSQHGWFLGTGRV